MPTAIYTEPVTDAMSWTGADFTSKEDFAFDLSARNVAALESILATTALSSYSSSKGRPKVLIP